jgi:hypothetical protein
MISSDSGETNSIPKPTRGARRGSVLIYSLLLMTIMLAMTSFAVDYGRLQLVKCQLQRNADSAARGSLELYIEGASSDYTYWGPAMTGSRFNPVDNNNNCGIQPTVTFTWGSWNSTTKTFTAGTGTPVAVQVTVSRTAANGNAVPLTFPLINGKGALRTTCDVTATAIAVLSANTTATSTVNGTSDPWLAGMPNGSEASDYDTAPAESPPLVMNVTPGTVLTFTNVSGGVKHDPSLADDTANGNTSQIYSHNCDDPINEPAVQNGIGDIDAPIDSLIGLFLTGSAPNTQSAPTTTLDYSTQAARDQVNTTGLQNQQPFFIGTGTTSGGTTKTYVVPAGATRLYLGTMDGHQWSNNSGSFSATITQQQQVYLVK